MASLGLVLPQTQCLVGAWGRELSFWPVWDVVFGCLFLKIFPAGNSHCLGVMVQRGPPCCPGALLAPQAAKDYQCTPRWTRSRRTVWPGLSTTNWNRIGFGHVWICECTSKDLPPSIRATNLVLPSKAQSGGCACPCSNGRAAHCTLACSCALKPLQAGAVTYIRSCAGSALPLAADISLPISNGRDMSHLSGSTTEPHAVCAHRPDCRERGSDRWQMPPLTQAPAH